MFFQIDNVLISTEIITEKFCCDLDACTGICCVEGDAGAPVTLEEIGGIEDALDTVWGDMSAQAQAVVDKQGVAYTDRDGDLVTSIVGGKDCVFTCYEGDCCLCALERAYRAGKLRQRHRGAQLPPLGRVQGRREEGSRTRVARIQVPRRSAHQTLRQGVVRGTLRGGRPLRRMQHVGYLA